MQVNDSGGTSGLSVLSPLVDLGLGGLQFGPHSTSLQIVQTKHCRMFLKMQYKILKKKFQEIKNLQIGPKHNEIATHI